MTQTTSTLLLTDKAIEAVKGSQPTKNRLQYEMNVSPSTVSRWLKSKDIILTTAQALNIISLETGIPKHELLQSA